MQHFTVESATSSRELPDGSVYQPHCTYAVGKHNHNVTYLKVCDFYIFYFFCRETGTLAEWLIVISDGPHFEKLRPLNKSEIKRFCFTSALHMLCCVTSEQKNFQF